MGQFPETFHLSSYKAGTRVWLIGLIAAAAMTLLLVLPGTAGAQETPGVEVGDGTVRVGDGVFAGDGCARAGDVVAGDCDADSGTTGTDGESTEVTEKAGQQPKNGGETSSGEETGPGEATLGTTGSRDTESETTGGSTFSGGDTTESLDVAACPTFPPEDAPVGTVGRVLDGDTVEFEDPVEGYDTVRLIGVDSPEMDGEDGPQPGAEEATEFTTGALEGEEVALGTDEMLEDPHGRLLAYVWLGGETEEPELFNETLLAEGHAELMIVEPNDAYAECLAATEERARDDRVGIWAAANQSDEGGDRKGLLGKIRDLLSSEPEPFADAGTTAEEPSLSEDQYAPGGLTGEPEATEPESTAESTSPEQNEWPRAASPTQETTGEETGFVGLADVPPEECPGATVALESFGAAQAVQSPSFEITGDAFVARTDLRSDGSPNALLEVSILDTEAQKPVQEFDQRVTGSYDTLVQQGPGTYLLDLQPVAGSYEVAVFDCAGEEPPAATGRGAGTTSEAPAERDPGVPLELGSGPEPYSEPTTTEPDAARPPNGALSAPTLKQDSPHPDLSTRDTSAGEVEVLPETGGARR